MCLFVANFLLLRRIENPALVFLEIDYKLVIGGGRHDLLEVLLVIFLGKQFAVDAVGHSRISADASPEFVARNPQLWLIGRNMAI